LKIDNSNKYKINNQAFGAKIWVTQSQNFNKLPLQILRRTNQYVGEPWDVYTSVKSLDEGYTDVMSVCTAGFIQNGTNAFLFHLQPENRHNHNSKAVVEKTLIYAISKLRGNNDNVTAFLTGGASQDESSEGLYFVIKDVLKNENIPFSSVWGHKELHWTDLFASAKSQKIVVNHNRDRQIVKNRQDIEKIYEDIFIHKGDEFVF